MNRRWESPRDDSPRSRTPPPLPPLLAFGSFELDTSEPSLRRRGATIKLQPQPLSVLCLLAEGAGEVVTRDEIRDHVWGQDVHVDFDRSINACIKAIRAALGDRARSPRFVETVPKRGYRFVAPVEFRGTGKAAPVEAPGEHEASSGEVRAGRQAAPVEVLGESEASGEGRIAREVVPAAAVERVDTYPRVTPAALRREGRGGYRRVAYGLAAATAAAALALAAVRSGSGDGGATASRDSATAGRVGEPSRLVVLPFAELGADEDELYLGDALAAELISALGRRYARRLSVIAWTSAMRYRSGAVGIDELAAALDVDYVVEGTIWRAQDRLRVTAQLVQVADRTTIWADEYDRDLADALALQTELGDTIAFALALELLPGLRHDSAADVDPDAHQAYLRGRYLVNTLDAAGMARAIQLFERAIQLSPGFAAAHAGLARAQLRSAGDPSERVPLAYAAAVAALALDPDNPEAHLVLAQIQFLVNWDLTGAGRALERTIELDPGFAEAHNTIASYYAATGQHDRARRAGARALELDPLSSETHTDQCWLAYFARDYDRAIAHARDGLDLQPGFVWAHRCIIFASVARRDVAAAVASARELMRVLGADADALAALDHPEPDEAMRGYWRWALARFSAMGSAAPQAASGFVHLALGDREAALAAFEVSYGTRKGWRVLFLPVDPWLDPLRDDPRFADLVTRIRALSRPRAEPARSHAERRLRGERRPTRSAP